jgi:hypothetical protein
LKCFFFVQLGIFSHSSCWGKKTNGWAKFPTEKVKLGSHFPQGFSVTLSKGKGV